MRKRRQIRTSRLERVKRKREIKQALVYFLLAGGIVVGVFVWGVPALAKLAGILIKDKPAVQEEVLPPAQPILSIIPEATNSAFLKVEGTTEAGAEVEIYLNNMKVETVLASEEGSFEVSGLQLERGDNWLYAVAVKANQRSEKSSDYHVYFDDQKPEIEILEPQGKQEFRGEEERTVTIVGKADKEIEEAMIGDRVAILEEEGKFRTNYQLEEGEQEIKVRVRDKAGNEAETSLKLRWYP